MLCPEEPSNAVEQGGQTKVEKLKHPIEAVFQAEVLHRPLAYVVFHKWEGPRSKDMIVDLVNGPVEMTLTPLVISHVTSTDIPCSPWGVACAENLRVVYVHSQLFIPACLSIDVRTREEGGRLDLLERIERVVLPNNPSLSM